MCPRAGTSSASIPRDSQEYSDWSDTNVSNPLVRAVQSASSTCQPAKFDEPR